MFAPGPDPIPDRGGVGEERQLGTQKRCQRAVRVLRPTLTDNLQPARLPFKLEAERLPRHAPPPPLRTLGHVEYVVSVSFPRRLVDIRGPAGHEHGSTADGARELPRSVNLEPVQHLDGW